MKQQLYDLFITEDKSASEIGKILGFSTNQIYAKLFKYNIRKQKQRKTKWYNATLKNLTDEEIYILGFLWADGYLTNKKKDFFYNLACQILFTDYTNIKSIFNKVGCWSEYIREAKTDKKNVHRKQNILLTISDVSFIKKLVNVDFDKKNHVSPEKLLKLIPKKKHYLFYRGYFDGDGCWYVKHRYKQFFVSSSYQQDWSCIINLFNKLNIQYYNIKNTIRSNGHKDSMIRISNLDDVTKLAKYIYKDRLDIGLNRKYQKIEHIL